MSFKCPSFSIVFGLVCLALPMVAHAQTLEAELGRVDKLRKTFGDEFVSGLTNLPPKKYFAARDQALALADQVQSGSVARAEAKKSMCDSFAKLGGNGCPALAEQPTAIAELPVASETAVSAVKKISKSDEDDLAAVGEELPTSPETETPERAPRSTKLSQVEEALPEGPALDGDEPKLESGSHSSVSESEAEPSATDHVAVPKRHRRSEPELESDTPEAAGREVSSEVPLSPEPQS